MRETEMGRTVGYSQTLSADRQRKLFFRTAVVAGNLYFPIPLCAGSKERSHSIRISQSD